MLSKDVAVALASVGVSSGAIALLRSHDPDFIAALNAIAALAEHAPATSSLDSAVMPRVPAAARSFTLEPALMTQWEAINEQLGRGCLLYTSPSPRDS